MAQLVLKNLVTGRVSKIDMASASVHTLTRQANHRNVIENRTGNVKWTVRS